MFVLCSSRSGSTLLRLILDSHPDFCCPPELHLVGLIQRMIPIYRITTRSDPAVTDVNSNRVVSKKIRDNVNRIMREHSDQLGKPVWCEKSVYTIDAIGAVQFAFPEARFICLYRSCLDQVSSALETLKEYPSGREYGFDPFLGREPGSPVDALIDYWCAKTSAIIGFEQKNPGQCIHLHYEDLVLESNAQLERLFGFLGSHWDEQMLDSIFTRSRKGGPGDHKIKGTDRILTSSLGRGAQIDIPNISADRLEKMNHLLETLGYDAANL